MKLKTCLSWILTIVFVISLLNFTPFAESTASAADPFDNSDYLSRIANEAISQYKTEDYTALQQPAVFPILWLGFRNVTYRNLDFRMTAFDEQYLKSVVLNFEKSLERITNYNLDIQIDFHLIDEAIELTKDDFLYLSQSSVQDYIDFYNNQNQYHSVITTVQSAGEENRIRNENHSEYWSEYVILGVMTGDCMRSDIGYSSFDLGVPIDGTYPLNDPKIPSLYATSVAVHEWMHQLESIGTLLNVRYPDTHAYIGPDEFPGYLKYEGDKNNYDLFEFYELVLQGRLPYTQSNGSVKHVGMYPKMWKFLTEYCNDSHGVGYFKIATSDGKYYLSGNTEARTLTTSSNPFIWKLRKDRDGYYVISPKNHPELRFDLNNAWDIENNTVGLHVDTGYIDAQRWNLSQNKDGTYSIQTVYGSGRAISIDSPGSQAVLKSNPNQTWIICKEGESVNDYIPDSNLNISLHTLPSSIEQGTHIQLRGSISSNYRIQSVEAVVFDASGIGHYPKTVHPNSSSISLESTSLRDGIYFEGLPPGTYTLKITATDEKTTKSISHTLRVVESKSNKFSDRNKNAITVYVNEKKINFDVNPRLINNRTMVPMRAIFEALGATVSWDGTTKTAIGTTKKTTIRMTVGKDYLLKNSTVVPLDSPAVIISSRTLVPARAIAESLDCDVVWHQDIQVVEITK